MHPQVSSPDSTPIPPPPLRAALRFPVFIALAAFLSWTLLRVVLFVKFHPEGGMPAKEAGKMFAAGLHLDAAMALAAPVVLTALAGLLCAPAWLLQGVPALRRWPLWRWLFILTATAAMMAGVFLLISEWYFFEEFDSRFNTVAIDYLLYPHEVVTNIRESYPVPGILAACGLLGGAAAWLAFRRFTPDWRTIQIVSVLGITALLLTATVVALQQYFQYGVAAASVLLVAAVFLGRRLRPRWRSMGLTGRIAGVLLWLAATGAAFISIRPEETAFSKERVVNELANNGWASAMRAAWSRHLDFRAFYYSLPLDEAFQRARRLLDEPGVTFAGPEVPPLPEDEKDHAAWLDAARLSLVRDVAGDAAKPRLNVCIVLEESLGSEFWGALGGRDKQGNLRTLTPAMDKLATEKGMLFTRILADGNRTIRGFEGVFSSFPPLPGDAILARDRTGRVETIARVLQRDGYQSLFLYGGHGSFDYISSYTLPNGWDRLIEQKDFDHPAHTTAWGVSDEDLFHRGIEEMRTMHASGKPFLCSFMTVSNHKPYTFPDDRIGVGKSKASRDNAVRYADWALGDFFHRAQAEPFWKDTIFAVIADHGARIYGHQTIPLESYQIPFLLAGGPLKDVPCRVDVPGCQLDVAPTILGLLGRPWRSLLFGHDLLKPGAAERDHSLMHHNRSIAIYENRRQVVFGLNQTVECWQGEISGGNMMRVHSASAIFRELQNNGAALFTAADALYTNRRFILPE